MVLLLMGHQFINFNLVCATLFKYRHNLLTFLVYKEAVTLTSADKSLVCAIRIGATEEYQTTSSPSFLARSIAQWEKNQVSVQRGTQGLRYGALASIFLSLFFLRARRTSNKRDCLQFRALLSSCAMRGFQNFQFLCR